jgi:hypothetical protein
VNDDAGAVSSSEASRALIARLRHILGIDLHILQTLLLRGWSVIAGGVMVLFVPHWFDRVDQGYFYTFSSLIAVQIFFELGMNQVIVQIVSHEAAHLREEEDGSFAGSRASIIRLASLASLLTRWYRVAAIAFFVCSGVAGAFFFNVMNGHLRETAIWLVLVLFTAGNLYLSPSFAMLEGMGRVGDVARVRLTQSVAGYFIMWAALSLGAGLAGAPVLAGVGAMYTCYWLARRDRRIRWLRGLDLHGSNDHLTWRRDIFPLQWRIAISWMSGYFILQLLVPLAFSRQGAVAAGQLGLTLTIYNSLLSIGLSWVNARLPTIAGQIARNERAQARATFRGVIARSTAMTLAGSIAALVIIALMPPSMRTRFADVPTIACLALATTANCAIYAMATFARAHREEPLLIQSLGTALVMAPALYLASGTGILAMAAVFAVVIAVFSLPWVALVFRRYYNRF